MPFFSRICVILSCSFPCLLILLKTWHFRYYTIATLDIGWLPLGFLLLFVYCIYSLARSFQWSLFPHPPSVWSPWCSSSRGTGFGYSQSYHKMSAVLAGLPVSFPDKTQLLSITTCQPTALLFSMMLWSINCSKDWSKQISAPLKRAQCLGFWPQEVSFQLIFTLVPSSKLAKL